MIYFRTKATSSIVFSIPSFIYAKLTSLYGENTLLPFDERGLLSQTTFGTFFSTYRPVHFFAADVHRRLPVFESILHVWRFGFHVFLLRRAVGGIQPPTISYVYKRDDGRGAFAANMNTMIDTLTLISPRLLAPQRSQKCALCWFFGCQVLFFFSFGRERE